MIMTSEVRREVIKALARGFSEQKTADAFGVTLEEVKSVTPDEIEHSKDNLRKWGRL